MSLENDSMFPDKLKTRVTLYNEAFWKIEEIKGIELTRKVSNVYYPKHPEIYFKRVGSWDTTVYTVYFLSGFSGMIDDIPQFNMRYSMKFISLSRLMDYLGTRIQSMV